jgi:hypothetical protein
MKTGSLAGVTQKQEVVVVGFEGVLESLGPLAETKFLGLALVLLGGDPKIRSAPCEADFLTNGGRCGESQAQQCLD